MTGEVWTVLVAAGSASRFGGDKLGAPLRGDRSVLDVALDGALASSDGVVLVVRGDDDRVHRRGSTPIVVVEGGATRSQSVRCGLAEVPDDAGIVLVHDAARPLADHALYRRVIAAVRRGAVAAVPAVEVVDSLRWIDGGPLDRERIRAVQTPQGFSAGVLRRAHQDEAEATDDASLVEATGGEIVLVDGDVHNLKITRPTDLDVARMLLARREA